MPSDKLLSSLAAWPLLVAALLLRVPHDPGLLFSQHMCCAPLSSVPLYGHVRVNALQLHSSTARTDCRLLFHVV